MESSKIIAIKEKSGGYSGFFKDRPDILAEGDDYKTLVKNLKSLRRSVEKFEIKLKQKEEKVKSAKSAFFGIKKVLKSKKK